MLSTRWYHSGTVHTAAPGHLLGWLGPLPRATPGRIAELIQREWGEGLIRSWNDAGWIDLPIEWQQRSQS
jgi:kynureninase